MASLLRIYTLRMKSLGDDEAITAWFYDRLRRRGYVHDSVKDGEWEVVKFVADYGEERILREAAKGNFAVEIVGVWFPGDEDDA